MKKLALIFLIPLIAISFFSSTEVVLALDDYTLLAPIDGLTKSGDTTDLTTYIQGSFNLAITIGAVLAFIMITYGGIIYATTDALSGKEMGRGYITDAVVGLILVLSSWVILYTINPNMVSFDLRLDRPKITEIRSVIAVTPRAGALPGYTLSAEQVAKNNEMRKDLKDKYNVGTNSGPCVNGEISGCTNLVGMPDVAYRGVAELSRLCGTICAVEITGGTEGGHFTHGPNLPTLDLGKNRGLDDYIMFINGDKTKPRAPSEMTSIGPKYIVPINGRNVIFLDEKGGAPHWHVNF
ncbi:MAG: pilin [Patescibacteria group bacterium]